MLPLSAEFDTVNSNYMLCPNRGAQRIITSFPQMTGEQKGRKGQCAEVPAEPPKQAGAGEMREEPSFCHERQLSWSAIYPFARVRHAMSKAILHSVHVFYYEGGCRNEHDGRK